jgi:hypothetical protein
MNLYIVATNGQTFALNVAGGVIAMLITDPVNSIIKSGEFKQYPEAFVKALEDSLKDANGDVIVPQTEGMIGFKVSYNPNSVILFAGQSKNIVQLNLSKQKVREIIDFIKSHFQVDS